jgi:ribosomal protein L37E
MAIPEEAKKTLKMFAEIYRAHFPQSERPLTDKLSLPPSIECPRCHRVSFHPQDVSEGYCAHCHDFTTAKKLHQPIELQGER